MKGDFSKNTFDPRSHFSSVRLQQGRVVTDADWNEQADLTRYRVETETADVIGACGGPEAHAGFALTAGTFAAAVAAVGNDAWIAGQDGVVLRTLDGGATWTVTSAPTTAHLRAIRFVDASVGWAVGDGGTILRTTNAGATWTVQSSGTQVALLGVAAVSATQAWAVGEGGTVLRTSDGGATWIGHVEDSGRIYAVHFVTPSLGWMVGQDGRIWTTDDGAVTWTAATSGVTAHLRAVTFVDALNGWAAGDDGTILHTADGGTSWTAQPSGVVTALFAIAARNASEVWAAGDGGTILETANGGSTWQFVDAGQESATLRGIGIGAAPHGWIVGDDSTLVALEHGSPPVQRLPAVSLSIEPGRYYVDGVLCEAETRTSFYNQPDRRVATRLPAGTHLVYLDVWQRHLSYLEEPEIREVALGGPDTASRGQTVWQLRTMPLGVLSPPDSSCLSAIPEWDALVSPTTARLRARAEPEELPASVCELGAAAGYRRVENQLYRVEIHTGGASPTFKWSRENGSVAFAIDAISETAGQATLRLAGRGLDDNLSLVKNGWVEVLDDDAVLEHAVGVLRRFVDIGNDPLEIVLDGSVAGVSPSASRHPLVRRWDHRPSGSDSALPVTEGTWMPLEDGVEVFFEPGGSYRPGDYWEIPARTITADVEWPRDEHGAPASRRPAGIEHRYCRMAILEVAGDGTVEVTSDCRTLFPPLTALTRLEYVSGDGQDGIPGRALPHLLRARVVRGNRPVENALVRFDVTQGEGHVNSTAPGGFVDVSTSADGVAACVWTLDPNISALRRHQTVVASLVDVAGHAVPGQQVGFHATGTVTLAYVSGDGQQAAANTQLTQPIEVRVANGQTPVASLRVHFTVVSGGGSLSATSALTGFDGVARVMWRLGGGGTQLAVAEIRDPANARVQHVLFNATVRAAAGAGGCELTVGQGGDLERLDSGQIVSLLQQRRRVCLCLLPGEHKTSGLIVEADGFLTIHGCGPGTTLHMVGPSRFAGLSSVTLAGMSIQVESTDAGIQFLKCRDTALARLDLVVRGGYAGHLLEFGGVTDVTIGDCSISERDAPENQTANWSAVVFGDAGGIKRVERCEIRGMVSLYGRANPAAEFAAADLAALLDVFPRARLQRPTGAIFFDGNSLERITVADSIRARLIAMIKGAEGTFAALFRSATLVGNRIRDRRSIVFTDLIAVGSTCLDLPPEGADVLGTLFSTTATVTGTVSNLASPRQGAAGPRNELWVLTAVGRCFESANAVVVRHV